MKRRPRRRRRSALGSAQNAVAVCKFTSARAKSQAIAAFMRAHGDDLPPEVLRKATSVDKLRTWVTLCDEKGLAAAMRYEHNDWYLCTLKNAAVRPDLRGRGLGRELYQQTTARASGNPSCLVLAADVTYDNMPSIKALQRSGFHKVSRFCWKRGEKPADVMHMIRLPATDSSCP